MKDEKVRPIGEFNEEEVIELAGMLSEGKDSPFAQASGKILNLRILGWYHVGGHLSKEQRKDGTFISYINGMIQGLESALNLQTEFGSAANEIEEVKREAEKKEEE